MIYYLRTAERQFFMPSQAELYSKFSSFPTPEHVQTVCKPGQGAQTCRYLGLEPGRHGSQYACEKASDLRGGIDERIEAGTMKSQGDNCAGTLGFIVDNQNLLVGNRTFYTERMPTIEKEGTFDALKIRDGYVYLNELDLAEDFTQVTIQPTGITLSARGFGAFVGSQTVFFEKPQETPAE